MFRINRNAQALSDLRPRARRAFKILRPALVAMRARNPCRRLRTKLEGSNVHFIASSPLHLAGHKMDSRQSPLLKPRL